MKLERLIISDLHLVTGSREGELNPLEDFFHDDRFAELRWRITCPAPFTALAIKILGF